MMWKKIKAYLQYIYPKRMLSRVMLHGTRIRLPFIKQLQIRGFMRAYQVDLSEAAETDINAYPEFNAFFTRALRPGARPIDTDDNALSSPADGIFSAAGHIHSDLAMQAKGQLYSIDSLLGDKALASEFSHGTYFTIYLSPRDYHRVHACAAGILKEIHYLPGTLFSVSPSTTEHIPRLFTRNERVILNFHCQFGPLAVILIGAVCVGSITTPWSESCVSQTPAHQRFPAPVKIAKGQEIGRFNMGSTVVVLVSKPCSIDTTQGAAVRMGAAVAKFLS